MGAFSKDNCLHCDEQCDFSKFINSDTDEELLRSMVKVHYKRKETIIKQNSLSSHLIFLRSGLVKVFTERRNDKNIILKLVAPNNFIGLSQLYSEVFNFSVIALKDSEVCLLPKENFYQLLSKKPELVNFFLESNTKFSDYLISKISSLGTKQMHGRLADVILYLCNKEFDGTSVFDWITRKDIAEMSGMSPESAIRLLTEFKNDGLIVTDGKKIEINNIELISRLSEIG